MALANQPLVNTSSDTTAPAPPVLDLLASSDSGTSSTDNRTNDDTPTIRVAINTGAGATAAVAGDTVRLYSGATQVGSAVLTGADLAAGYVDITSSVLAAGSRSMTATVTDADSNVSTASAALVVVVEAFFFLPPEKEIK